MEASGFAERLLADLGAKRDNWGYLYPTDCTLVRTARGGCGPGLLRGLVATRSASRIHIAGQNPSTDKKAFCNSLLQKAL